MQDAGFRNRADSRLRGGCHVVSGGCDIWRRKLSRFQIGRECQTTVADADDVSGFNRRVATHAVSVDVRPVATSQITHMPFAAGAEYFAVIPAARIILQDDAIRGGPADRSHLAVSQANDVSPDCTVPCEQEGDFGGGQYGDVLV